MKKLLSLLLAAMMALSLAACGGDTGDTGTNEDGTVTANPDWPNAGTINCVIGWSAGGTTDLIARKVASEMSIVTESNNNCTNVTGASGSIAAAQVMTSADGETAWGGMISAINTWRAMGYNDQDWQDWYCFISAQTDYVLCVAGNSEFETYQDFVDYAKANPGALNAGNPGLGSVGHLAAVTMNQAFGIETNHVPYAGGRAAGIGVMGGEIDYVFIAYGDVYDLIQSGDLKALAITGAEDYVVDRSDGSQVTIPALDGEYPEIGETCSQLGFWGVALPRTVPADQLLAFQQAWETAVTSESYISYCEEIGVRPVAIDGTEADQTMAQSEATYVEILEGLDMVASTAEELGIPAPADYSWDNVDTSELIAWPTAG